MAIITKKITTTRKIRPVQSAKTRVVVTEVSDTQTLQYLIYLFFGMVEVLLAFRLVLKLTGANVLSSFVNFIYSISGIFIAPFEGIFRRGYAPGIETTSVLEPSTLVAIIVYVVVAWGIITLVSILSGEPQEME
jgi:hypothetical protein